MLNISVKNYYNSHVLSIFNSTHIKNDKVKIITSALGFARHFVHCFHWETLVIAQVFPIRQLAHLTCGNCHRQMILIGYEDGQSIPVMWKSDCSD